MRRVEVDTIEFVNEWVFDEKEGKEICKRVCNAVVNIHTDSQTTKVAGCAEDIEKAVFAACDKWASDQKLCPTRNPMWQKNAENDSEILWV